MERSGRCRALFGCEGLPDAQPREGEFHGGHRRAESVDGVWGGLGDGRVVGLGCASRGWVLAGCGFGGGCCGHSVRGISFGVVGWKARPRRLVAARAGKTPRLVTISERWEARSATEATVEPSVDQSGSRQPKTLNAEPKH